VEHRTRAWVAGLVGAGLGAWWAFGPLGTGFVAAAAVAVALARTAGRRSRAGKWLVRVGLPLLVLGGAVAVFALRGEGEPLTAEALAAARARWEANGPRSYALEIEVSGGQSNRHRVEVRDGAVVSMVTGGWEVELRLGQYWTVEGMLDSLATELRNAAAPERAYGVSDPSRVELRVVFDEDLGYPRRFLRHVLGGHAGIQWKVVSFRRLP